ncbi:MAG: class I SAM-dependent methyltransferase [Bacteroidota bacterium]
MGLKKEWFSEWFNSPYYHILYQNRDEKEAEYFLQNVVQKLHFLPEHRIIDLACGKGRHAIYLNSLGFDVTGVDLACKSIDTAQQHANSRLHFEVQDLRCLHSEQPYDIALNLFTSFGYFQSLEEDELVVKNIHSILKPKGRLLIDFMNVECVIQKLVERESKTINSIQFHISKWVEKGFIHKKIEVEDATGQFEFTEKVQALQLSDFQNILSKQGFTISDTYGNYALEPFKKGASERLIIVAQKND